MRQTFVRRILAALFVVVGLGVASSAVPASAHVTQPTAKASTVHHASPLDDWVW
jgi:hypothetical protein